MTALVVTQVTADALVLGDPNLRVTQVAADALVSGTPSLRVTQVALDVLVSVKPYRRPFGVDISSGQAVELPNFNSTIDSTTISADSSAITIDRG